MSTIDSPDYDFRYIWYAYGSPTDKLRVDLQTWYRHNRQRGWFNTATGHAYDRLVPRSLFDENPEYFALVDGKRGGNQLCTTDPEVLQLDRVQTGAPRLQRIAARPLAGPGSESQTRGGDRPR